MPALPHIERLDIERFDFREYAALVYGEDTLPKLEAEQWAPLVRRLWVLHKKFLPSRLEKEAELYPNMTSMGLGCAHHARPEAAALSACIDGGRSSRTLADLTPKVAREDPAVAARCKTLEDGVIYDNRCGYRPHASTNCIARLT